MSKKVKQKRQLPVRIPLTFDQAIDGLLAVKPRPAKKKAPAKKKG
jgi:hypothetical protein